MDENYSENLKYDEDDAVKFIREHIPTSVDQQYSDDEIIFVIDTIWDYYESKGVVKLNKTLTENEDTDLTSLVEYILKEIKRDGELIMDPEDLKYIVKGELAYEESIEIFDD